MVYQQEPCARTFAEDLSLHFYCGWIISTPAVFLMGRPVRRDAPYEQLTDPAVTFEQPDCWWIYLAAGKGVGEFWRHEPYPLPWIGWERRNTPRFYERERLKKLMILNNPIDLAMRCYKGRGPAPPPTPPPPSPSDAAEIVARQMREARRRKAFGFAETILGGLDDENNPRAYPNAARPSAKAGMSAPPPLSPQRPARPPTLLKRLLGE